MITQEDMSTALVKFIPLNISAIQRSLSLAKFYKNIWLYGSYYNVLTVPEKQLRKGNPNQSSKPGCKDQDRGNRGRPGDCP